MLIKNKGPFYATLSGLFFGLIGYFGLNVMRAGISVDTMLFWRFFVSSFFIFILLIPGLKNIKADPKEMLKLSFYGAIFYGSCSILYFLATEHIGSGVAMVIFFTYPAIVMLINSIFYRLKVTKIYYIALLVIFVGMICLVNGGPLSFNFIGIALAFLAALLYALYLIISKNSPLPPLLATFLITFGAMLICLVSALASGNFLIPTTFAIWFNILGIGIICTALPIVFLLKGLKHISSLQAAILSVLEPVFVLIFGITLLGEQINLIQALGVTILLIGALLTLLRSRFED